MATMPETSTKIRLKGCRENQIRQRIEDSYESKEWREYRTDYPRRGRAVIANFNKFNGVDNEERSGSEKDVEALQTTLGTNLKFDVETWDLNGVNATKFLEMVKDESTNPNHRDGDCFVMVIMTHGYTNGTLCAYEGLFNLDDVISYFTGQRCSYLRGKPKIFIIQACRGREGQSAVYIAKGFSKPRKMISLPVYSDILIAQAQYEGYYSMRHPEKGSYFIQSLCYGLDKDFMKKDEDKDDLVRILTFVSYSVANYEFYEIKETDAKPDDVQPDFGGEDMAQELRKEDVVGAIEDIKRNNDLGMDTKKFLDPPDSKPTPNVDVRMVKQQPTLISTLLQLFYLRSKLVKPKLDS